MRWGSLALVLCAIATPARAQLYVPAQDLTVLFGIGVSAPYRQAAPDENDEPGSGIGLFGAAEYSLAVRDWFVPRAYAGLLMTFNDADQRCREGAVDCRVWARIGFLGAKMRVLIPIPYVAPLLELGIGASIGALETRTPSFDEELAGVTYHIPFSAGFALGKNREFVVMLSLLFHPDVRQVGGALAGGFTIRLAEAIDSPEE